MVSETNKLNQLTNLLKYLTTNSFACQQLGNNCFKLYNCAITDDSAVRVQFSAPSLHLDINNLTLSVQVRKYDHGVVSGFDQQLLGLDPYVDSIIEFVGSNVDFYVGRQLDLEDTARRRAARNCKILSRRNAIQQGAVN